MMKYKFAIVWGYAAELILAGVLLFLVCMIFDKLSLVNFIRQSAIDLATLFCAIFFAAALGFLWTFYSKADTEFYRWLHEYGAFTTYLYATGYVVGIEAISTIMLVITKQIPNDTLALAAGYLFLMAAINGYTLIVNVFGLMRLNAHYNQLKSANI